MPPLYVLGLLLHAWVGSPERGLHRADWAVGAADRPMQIAQAGMRTPAAEVRSQKSAEQPTPGTEVFTGGGEVLQPRDKPVKPVTTYWRVQLFVKMTGIPPGAHVQVLLPLSDPHQEILGRRVETDGFTYREEPEPPNLWGHWTRTASPSGGTQFEYEVTAALTDTVETIPRVPLADLSVPDAVRGYLQPSPMVQSADPDVRRRARNLIKEARTVEDAAWSLFQYAAAFVRTGPGEAKEDAVTVLRQERGSSAGKARLLTALLRSIGVPARVVGGLKLEDATKKRATISWVEAYVDGAWVPLDPGGGYFGWLPNQYLALYRGDLPLIVHTSGLSLDYDFLVHRTSRDTVAFTPPTPPAPRGPAETQVGTQHVRTAASYVERPVASVVVIADQSVPDAVSERVLREAQADEINVVVLHARFESRYFREQYLQRLVNNNLGLIRSAHVLLIATHDDAGLYALMTLGERNIALDDMRIVIAGDFPRAVGRVLGAVLYRLLTAGEVILINRPAELLGLWEMVRANVINGVPMVEEARKWELKPLQLTQSTYEDLSWWRHLLVAAWVRAVRAQVPLQALTLILVLPVIAAIIVVVRTVIGVETFGTFSPVIVSLAFLTTGLRWGAAIFAVIVGVGAFVRALLQHVRLQLVARLAILIAVVAGVMAGLTVLGASFGIGALMNVSIFPMVIMSNVIENFTTSQAEFGTREAVRLTINTLGLAAICYLAIEGTSLQSLLLAFPELLLGAIAIDVGLGKWRGLRLLEYLRFFDLTRRSDRWAP
jgi:transglutaminase-like putative cysteine protease